MGYSTMIFSNAPFKWIHKCLSELESLSNCTLKLDDYITSDQNLLKPDIAWYNDIDVLASNVVFVDDSEINLIKHNWTNVLYSSNSEIANKPEDIVHVLETL
jgi:FMN phosphatase YigB (HAD superfamily)